MNIFNLFPTSILFCLISRSSSQQYNSDAVLEPINTFPVGRGPAFGPTTDPPVVNLPVPPVFDGSFTAATPPPAVHASTDYYRNFTRGPIDWSALLLNYTNSNENFNATTSDSGSNDAYRPPPAPDSWYPSQLGSSFASSPSPPSSLSPVRSPAYGNKRRKYRPDTSVTSNPPSSTTTTTTSSTTSTTRPPKIYLEPTIDIDEDEDDDPPRNIYDTETSDVDAEASESSQGSESGTDADERKELETGNKYSSYPVISSAKSRTKGNYVKRPYNYYDHVTSPSRPYYSSSRIGNQQQNSHRHHLHPSSNSEDDAEDESNTKYTMIRGYDPHRFASPHSLYPGYFHHPASIGSGENVASEEGYYPSYGYNGGSGGSEESSIHRHEVPSPRPGSSNTGLSSWSGLTGFLLGIIPLSLIVASLAPAFVSVPVTTAISAGRRRRRSTQQQTTKIPIAQSSLLLQRLLHALDKYER